jgi:ribosomal protein L36
MSARRKFRKSAVAMMMVTGGLGAAVPSAHAITPCIKPENKKGVIICKANPGKQRGMIICKANPGKQRGMIICKANPKAIQKQN